MFYQCPQCKKIWQFPIGECAECFMKLERIESKSAKVIAVSLTSLPTLSHMDVPYYVLLLQDENGNIWARKSEKEYKAGDEFEYETSAEKNVVAIARNKYDDLEQVEKLISFLGGINVSAQSKIIILPSISKANHSYLRDNTSQEFLEAVLQYLVNSGAKPENIKVIGQSFDDLPIEAKAQKSGLLEICAKFKVLPQDIGKMERAVKGEYALPKEALEADIFINLPIMKEGKASASANLLTLLDKDDAMQFRVSRESLENIITAFPNMFVIAEANIVQKRDRLTAFFGASFAGRNPILIDRVFAQTICDANIDPAIKNIKLEDIKVLGNTIKEISVKL